MGVGVGAHQKSEVTDPDAVAVRVAEKAAQHDPAIDAATAVAAQRTRGAGA
jgi:hypothetical protein